MVTKKSLSNAGTASKNMEATLGDRPICDIVTMETLTHTLADKKYTLPVKEGGEEGGGGD